MADKDFKILKRGTRVKFLHFIEETKTFLWLEGKITWHTFDPNKKIGINRVTYDIKGVGFHLGVPAKKVIVLENEETS